MKRDELKTILENEELEISDKIDEILNKHNSEKEALKVDDKSELVASLQAELDELKTETENLKNRPTDDTDVSELKAQLADLKENLKQEKINSAINVGIASSGIKNEKLASLVAGSLNRESITIDESGNVIGITEQLQAIKDDEAFKSLFKPVEIKPAEYVPKEGAVVEDKRSDGAKLAERVLAERNRSDENRLKVIKGE